MNLPRILHAALASIAFLNFQSASAAANTASAQVSEERQRDRSTAAAAAGARRNTHASPRPDESGKTGKAGPVKGQPVRANSDRVRSLLNRQAMRHGTAAATSRRAAAAPTAPGDVARPASGNPGPGTANPSQARAIPSQVRAIPPQGAASSAPDMAARRAPVAPPQNSAARTGTLGGPRAQSYARLGGPASAKPAHAAALNGTQVLRPKY